MIRRLASIGLGLALAAAMASPANAATTHPPVPRPAPATAATIRLTPGGGAGSADPGPAMVPPGEPGGYATVQTVLRYATGKRIGPSAYTGGGMFTITGFTQTPTGWARVRSAASCPSCETVGADLVTPDGLPEWAKPWTWDWKHIMGETWDAIWNHCMSGSVKGVVGTAGSTLLVNLIADGGKVFIGPYGYAAIAIGGCIALALD